MGVSKLKFIQMDFPANLLLAAGKQNSFYEDALPTEKYEATGFIQIPKIPKDFKEEKVGAKDVN